MSRVSITTPISRQSYAATARRVARYRYETFIVDMTVLEERFKKAVWLIRNGPPQKDTSNATKLKFYQYYKQATEGDVTGSQPWAVQVEARAKWDAWNSVKGMSKEDAMHRYIDLLTQDDPEWEQHDALGNFSMAA